MSGQQQHVPGGHYSGKNQVPTVKQLLESLDSDKKQRDRKIDELNRTQNHEGAKPHRQTPTGKAETRKRVTDPVTGKEVEIEDAAIDPMQAVKDPQVLSHIHWVYHCSRSIHMLMLSS